MNRAQLAAQIVLAERREREMRAKGCFVIAVVVVMVFFAGAAVGHWVL